jgi:lysophospholipase L1-like esterase
MLMREGRLCRGNGAAVKPYLDIYLQFKEKNDISKYFIDDIHCSANGHKEIAQIIYNYLLSSSWFLTGL